MTLRGRSTESHAANARMALARGSRPCFALFAATILFAAVCSVRAQTNETLAGQLQFRDGALLHGALLGIDPQRGVKWLHPAAAQPIEFLPRNVHQVRFDRTPMMPTNAPPSCRVRFINDDEVLGQLVSLDAHGVVLQTWFAGRVTAPRASLRSITFLDGVHGAFYEGPTGLEGWRLGAQNFIILGNPGGNQRVGDTPAWRFQDGALVAQGVGFIGRDLKLPDVARIEFDLAWQGALNMIVNFYTDALDRFDYSMGCYQLNIGAGYANLMRIQGNAGMMHLGLAQIPAMSVKNKVRLELRASRETATVALFADGQPVQTWRDPAGFAGQGTGIAFYSQRLGPSVRISNIRVSAWDGKSDEQSESYTNFTGQIVKLVNNDRVNGELQSIRENKLAIATAQAELNIPLPRVTQIILAADNAPVPPRPVGAAQVFLPTGEKITLAGTKWEAATASGVNPNFGVIAFQTKWVRLLEFSSATPKNPSDELDFFGGEVVWE